MDSDSKKPISISIQTISFSKGEETEELTLIKDVLDPEDENNTKKVSLKYIFMNACQSLNLCKAYIPPFLPLSPYVCLFLSVCLYYQINGAQIMISCKTLHSYFRY